MNNSKPVGLFTVQAYAHDGRTWLIGEPKPLPEALDLWIEMITGTTPSKEGISMLYMFEAKGSPWAIWQHDGGKVYPTGITTDQMVEWVKKNYVPEEA